MKYLPKISVITPCLNGAKYLDEAIQSVLIQDYPNFEHIVVDGGSTDGTIEILKKYPHVKWLSEPDQGQSDAMNKGFAMSTGEIIVYLNADDYFEPGAFRAATKALAEKPAVFVVGLCRVINERDALIEVDDPVTELHKMLQWWRYSFPKNPVSYFYRRSVQEAVGLFDVNNHYAMDYDFLLRVAGSFPITRVNQVLGTFRWLPGTKTFESCNDPAHDSRLDFSKAYWRPLSARRRLALWVSWVYFHRLRATKSYARRIIGYPYRAAKRVLAPSAAKGR